MLPLEIWQMILRYSISVPGFLDPDEILQDRFPPWVIAKRGYSNESSYYEVERTRNILRRVCKWWDEYLQQYAHRFVCLTDVVHGNVPMQYLRSAIRVSFGDHSIPVPFGDHTFSSMCSLCKPEQFRAFLPDFQDSLSHLLWLILKHATPLRAEIISPGPGESTLFYEFILEHSLSSLICIQAMDKKMPSLNISQVFEALPSLRHLNTVLPSFEEETLSLKSSTLTNLSLSFVLPSPSIIITDKDLYLPALRHLRILKCRYKNPNYHDEPAWLPFVKIVGKELRTLYVPMDNQYTGSNTPEYIWNICPRLEDLSSRMRPPITTPPLGHPIHTIGISSRSIAYYKPIEESVPNWPSLHTIRITGKWKFWRAVGRGPLTSSQLEWLDSRNLLLEDSCGDPYKEYISRVEPKKNAL
jgi:hypothetical protein